MQKIIFLLSLVFIIEMPLLAQNVAITENQYYQMAKEALKKIETAYDYGNYDAAEELKEEFQDLLDVSEANAQAIILKYRTENNRRRTGEVVAAAEVVKNAAHQVFLKAYDKVYTSLNATQEVEARARSLAEKSFFDDAIMNYKQCIQQYKSIYDEVVLLKDTYATSEMLRREAASWKSKAEKQLALLEGFKKNIGKEYKEKFNEAYTLYKRANTESEALVRVNELTELNPRYSLIIRYYTDSATLAGEITDALVNKDKKTDALKLYDYALKRYHEAKNAAGAAESAENLKLCEEYLAKAKDFLDNAQYNRSMDYSEQAIVILDKLGLGTVFPRYYRVRLIPDDRDCLWNIAAYKWVYNNSHFWPHIFVANEDKLKDRGPHLIYPGELFFIPSLADEQRTGNFEEDKKYSSCAAPLAVKGNTLLKPFNGIIKSVDAEQKTIKVEAEGRSREFKSDKPTIEKLKQRLNTNTSFHFIEMKSGSAYLIY